MPEPQTTTIAEQAKPPHPMIALRDSLNARMAEFKNALPRHITPERFIRVVLTAVQLNPNLIACNRQTLFNACMRAANDGLLPDGRAGVIIDFNDNNDRSPYKGQKVATWMPMVAGLIQRFRNSGEFKSIMAGVVRDGEPFEHWIDENGEHLKHTPGDGEGGNDKITKAYAIAALIGGGTMIKVMSREDIEKRRKSGKAPNSLMWTTFYDEGCMKTVLRNLSKRLPSSSDDVDRMMERDDELYGIERATPATALPPRPTDVTAALDQFGGGEPAAAEQPVDDAAKVDSPPTQPDVRIDTARERGVQARRDNVQRRAIPGEYREAGREAEADAWRDGWDNAPAS